MASVNIEKRYCRVEDWECNQYYFSSTSGAASGSTVGGGDAINPGTSGGGGTGGEGGTGGGGNYDQEDIDKGNITTTDGQSTTDTSANTGNSVIISSDASQDKNVITTKIDGIPFGKVAVDVRLKSTVGSGSTNILRINCYYVDNNNTTSGYKGTLLSTTNVTGDMIGVTGKYTNIGFVTEFSGSFSSSFGFKVEVLLLKNTNATINLDQISVNKSYAAITGMPTSYN